MHDMSRPVRFRLLSLATTRILFLVTLLQPSFVFSTSLTEEQGTAILNELRQIRQLLERQQQAQGHNRANAPIVKAILKVGANPSLGYETAPVILVEFTDFECPFCKRFHQTTFLELKRKYIDAGKMRYISRDMPLATHQHAEEAAHAVRCAGEQNQYWQAYELVFGLAPNLARDNILKAMTNLSVDQDQFLACLDSKKYSNAIQQDIAEAQSLGIAGTPGFILGTKIDSEAIKISGAQPISVFDKHVADLLEVAK